MARKLKIYSQSMGGGNYTQAPTIVLKCQWLKAAGFESGTIWKSSVMGTR